MNRLLAHDGTYGSGIWRFDGDVSTLGRFDTDSRAIPFDVLGGAPDKLIIGSAGGPGDPGVAALRQPGRRGGRAQPRDRRAAGGRVRRLHGPLPERPESTSTRATAAPTWPGATPLTTSSGSWRARQRRQQRGLVGSVRALGELPLHQEHDPGDARAPERRRDHGRAVRRAVVRDLAQPDQPLRRHSTPPSRPSASRTPAPTCWCRRRPTTAPTSAPSS